MAAKTSTIPIVLIASADPVAVGLVRSLARPGTNVTGMSGLYDQLLAKQIELLTEVVPRMSRVAYLSDSSSGTREQFEQVARDAASAKGLSLTIAAASDLQGIRRAFTEFAKERVHAVAVQPSGPMAFFRNAIAGEASRLRLPSISGGFQFAESGGLISYSASILENMRNQLPIYVDRILKGAKPADLPVQQSTKYEFVVNLKTARAIGITIPRSVLLRADRVIE
jgi:putative ABC transport system substrate-binding protein